MIRTETVIINGKEYVRTYSDAGYMIERGGAKYEEAIDPTGLGRTYTETDEPIPTEEYATETEEKAAAYDIMTGVSG